MVFRRGKSYKAVFGESVLVACVSVRTLVGVIDV